jgi:flagellin
MRELAVQSANDSNTSDDRASLQKEVSQLQRELNRISETTQFNNQNLLDGSFTSSRFQVGANKGQFISVSVGNTAADQIGNYQVRSEVLQASQGGDTAIDGTMVINGNQTSETITIAAGDSAKVVAASVNEKTGETGVSADAETNLKIDGVQSAGAVSFTLVGSNTGSGDAVTVATVLDDKDDLSSLVAAINDKAGVTGITARLDKEGALIMNSSTGDDIHIDNLNMGATGTATASFTTLDADGENAATATAGGNSNDEITAQGQVTFHSNGSFTVDTGSNANTNFLATGAASELENVAEIDISDQVGAGNALKVIDGAIAYLDSQRADLGAVMNRFESTIANLSNISENVSAARSRILDADIAQETSAMTKQNILQQAGVSILAQANQAPQLALSLLG